MTHDRVAVALVAVAIAITGCEREEESQSADKRRSIPLGVTEERVDDTRTPAGLRNTPIAPGIRQPEQSAPAAEELSEPEYIRVGRVRGFPYAGVRRWEVRIEIQPGHTRDEVGSIIETAARDAIAQYGGKAADVLAFAPGDDTSGMATIGQGVFAPNGRWGDAAKDAPMAFQLTGLRDEYFRTPDGLDRWAVGTTVTLRSSGDRAIRVSNSRDRWDSESEIAAVTPGTEALIMQRYVTPIASDMELIRYEVELEREGQTIRGWVSQWAVEGS
ncbi:MAG: hypothetical protein AAGB51_00900 [Planctomycetota bacterium]